MGFEPFSAVFSATSGVSPAVLVDERPWTWVHGQNTDNDTSSRPGFVVWDRRIRFLLHSHFRGSSPFVPL